MSISEAQLAANRANAQHSTGATTPDGKAKSAQNALKHGLTSQTVVLPFENADQYQHLLDRQIEIYTPASEEELALVQSFVDSLWRLERVTRIETAVLLKGQLELSKLHEDQPAFERACLIEAEAYIKYEKQLRNLNIQEARLRRLIDKQRAELNNIRAERRRQEQAEKASAPRPENGFDFTSAETGSPNQPQPDHKLKKQAA